MRKKAIWFAQVMSLATAHASAVVDMISVSGGFARKVTPAETIGLPGAPPAPLNGDVYQFFATTDGDILSVNQVGIVFQHGGPLYQHPLGNPAAKPSPDLIAIFVPLGADSYIDTPGNGTRLGPDLPGDSDYTTFGDLTNDGPVTNFLFAQLTVPDGSAFTFSGRISIAGTGGTHVFDQPFSFTVPEPCSGCLTAIALAICAFRRVNRA